MRLSLPTRFVLFGALLTVPALRGCTDATSIHRLEIDATGSVYGVAYLDNNGNGVLDTQDPPLPAVPVVLTVAQGGQVVDRVETDSAGIFELTDVPVGTYRLDLDSGALGDSLEAAGNGTEFNVTLGEKTRVDFAVSFPVLTIEEVRAAEPGRRVFTSGIALNPRQSFGDGVVYLQLDTAYVRTINVERASINSGDSVRVLGRVKIDQGEPVLDEVTPFVLVHAATIPLPVDIGTAEAADADGGRLDAALVRIHGAEISDTSTVDGNFRFQVDDGSGPVEIVFRSFLQLNSSVIRPDTVLRIRDLTGLLTPLQDATGTVHWRVLPRGGSDVTLEVKQADLGVGLSVDKPTASRGDTLTFTVVLTNAGPIGASGVKVTDSVPEPLTFVSASMTRGTYDSGAGVWNLDSMRVGATDTLKIKAKVTTSLLGQMVDRATVSKLLHEVDPNPNNNTAAIAVGIVAGAPGAYGLPTRQVWLGTAPACPGTTSVRTMSEVGSADPRLSMEPTCPHPRS